MEEMHPLPNPYQTWGIKLFVTLLVDEPHIETLRNRIGWWSMAVLTITRREDLLPLPCCLPRLAQGRAQAGELPFPGTRIGEHLGVERDEIREVAASVRLQLIINKT